LLQQKIAKERVEIKVPGMGEKYQIKINQSQTDKP
jgi:hypothetical protein